MTPGPIFNCLVFFVCSYCVAPGFNPRVIQKKNTAEQIV
jgi:hypothetical protein